MLAVFIVDIKISQFKVELYRLKIYFLYDCLPSPHTNIHTTYNIHTYNTHCRRRGHHITNKVYDKYLSALSQTKSMYRSRFFLRLHATYGTRASELTICLFAVRARSPRKTRRTSCVN